MNDRPTPVVRDLAFLTPPFQIAAPEGWGVDLSLDAAYAIVAWPRFSAGLLSEPAGVWATVVEIVESSGDHDLRLDNGMVVAYEPGGGYWTRPVPEQPDGHTAWRHDGRGSYVGAVGAHWGLFAIRPHERIAGAWCLSVSFVDVLMDPHRCPFPTVEAAKAEAEEMLARFVESFGAVFKAETERRLSVLRAEVRAMRDRSLQEAISRAVAEGESVADGERWRAGNPMTPAEARAAVLPVLKRHFAVGESSSGLINAHRARTAGHLANELVTALYPDEEPPPPAPSDAEPEVITADNLDGIVVGRFYKAGEFLYVATSAGLREIVSDTIDRHCQSVSDIVRRHGVIVATAPPDGKEIPW